MKVGEEEVSAGLGKAVMACGISYAPILLALGGVTAYLTLIPRAGGNLPFVLTLMYGLLAYFAIAAGIRTLLEIANNNADVIKGNPQLPAPYVLFVDFGDSSLNFELRAIIRDINQRRHVTSDINRAINAAFNKQGIEIPFPQRDVNFRGPLQIERDSKVPPEAPDGGELPQS